MHLVVCSNSSPAFPRSTDDVLSPNGSGGLVPHLISLLAGTDGAWVFADTDTGRRWPPRFGGVDLHPVPVDVDEGRRHYQTISIDVLQRTFHYLHNLATGPAFDQPLYAAWDAYREVNRRFAAATLAAQRGPGTDPVMLVNDYHLLLVPGAIRAAGPPAGSRLIYSHGVPWCGPDYFATLPGGVRLEILESLLACDVVVFHAARWRAAFAACCAHYLPAASVTDTTVVHSGRATRLAVQPFPLDTAAVEAVAASELAAQWHERLAATAGGRQLLVRVDRLDLWKNHLRGFASFAALLGHRPALAGEMWFLAVTTLPRYRSAAHREYEAACRSAVDRLNDRWGRPGRPVATLLETTNDRQARVPALVALYEASTVLINPTYEGYGMVAKEAVFAGGGPTILLSTSSGAYEQLGPVTTAVDPFDVVAATDLLAAAREGTLAGSGSGRDDWRRRIRAERTTDWLAATISGGVDGGS